MKKLFLLFVFLFFCLFFVKAVDTPYTPEVITARGPTILPVNFFNSGEGQTYTSVLEKKSLATRLEKNSIYVGGGEVGSFNLLIGELDIKKGIYFDNLIISNKNGVFQEIPVIVGFESKSSEIEYDVSINFNPNSDITVISGETILSPNINLYKLNFNNRNSNEVNLNFVVYSLDGKIISESQEKVSVSRQASFEHFFNLGLNNYNEVLIFVSAENGDSLGLDLYQVSISNSPFLSPPSTNDYSSMVYISVFIFLLSFVILISYLWYNHSLKQAKNWKGQVDELKNIKFSDSAKGLRRIQAQKDVLKRAYLFKYISKSSFDSAMRELDTLSNQIKKRL